MFAAPDGTLLDLPYPLLVVYAPPEQQRVKRERRTSSPPPIVRTGEAVSVRDLNHQISGGQFLKALQTEKHTRLFRMDMLEGTRPWNEYCDAFGGKEPLKMWGAGFPLALSVQRLSQTEIHRRFLDAMWKELMRLMGTKVASTTPYDPRSDGQAGHTNRVVEDMLRSFVGSNPEDWDLCWFWDILPCHTWTFFLQAATGQHSKRKGGEGTAHEMASKFAAQLEDARTKSELVQQRRRHQFDQLHTAKSFQLGDLVWVDAKHLTENIMNHESFRKLGPR
eukprot:gene6009-biopygen6040